MVRYFLILLVFFGGVANAESLPGIHVAPLPVIKNASPALIKSMDHIRAAVVQDGKECIGNATGMDVNGNYSAKFQTVLSNNKILILDVAGDSMCDGVHTSSYQYVIALDLVSGARVDLNKIYQVANRVDGHLFLKKEVLHFVEDGYKNINRGKGYCMQVGDLADVLGGNAVTFSPTENGRLVLYYAVPDILSNCLSIVDIDLKTVLPFTDKRRAAIYDLP